MSRRWPSGMENRSKRDRTENFRALLWPRDRAELAERFVIVRGDKSSSRLVPFSSIARQDFALPSIPSLSFDTLDPSLYPLYPPQRNLERTVLGSFCLFVSFHRVLERRAAVYLRLGSESACVARRRVPMGLSGNVVTAAIDIAFQLRIHPSYYSELRK